MLPPSEGINAMNESAFQLEHTEDGTFTDKVSDEALEAAASDTMGKITFSFSIHPMYCNFC
jgi:hypothetical protein